jgi:chemotaxis signal transduction protein
MKEHEFPWVSFHIGNRLLGVDCSYVKEMQVMDGISQLPNMPGYIKGVINLRGSVILVLDLRTKLGMKSSSMEIEELVELLGKREQDHHNWLNELENAVKENREFKLTTNPHACAFGKWYDTFKAPNIILENHLKKFDVPHKRIHALGIEALGMQKAGKQDEAVKLIEHERGYTLALLVVLFAEAKKLLRETLREIVIILKKDNILIGLAVDDIDSVAYLKEGSVGELSGLEGFLKHGMVNKTGKTLKGDKLVMLMSAEEFFTDSTVRAAAEAHSA